MGSMARKIQTGTSDSATGRHRSEKVSTRRCSGTPVELPTAPDPTGIGCPLGPSSATSVLDDGP